MTRLFGESFFYQSKNTNKMVTIVKHTVKLIFIFILLLFSISCSTKGGQLQEYFVASSDKPDFISFTIATSIFDVSEASLTPEEKELYQSIQKVNVLLLPNKHADTYEKEEKEVISILKGSDFEELVSISDKNMKGKLYFIGDDEQIDEVVLFGKQPEKGFAVVRLLGDHLKTEDLGKIMQVFQKAKVEDGAFDMLKDYF